MIFERKCKQNSYMIVLVINEKGLNLTLAKWSVIPKTLFFTGYLNSWSMWFIFYFRTVIFLLVTWMFTCLKLLILLYMYLYVCYLICYFNTHCKAELSTFETRKLNLTISLFPPESQTLFTYPAIAFIVVAMQ